MLTVLKNAFLATMAILIIMIVLAFLLSIGVDLYHAGYFGWLFIELISVLFLIMCGVSAMDHYKW